MDAGKINIYQPALLSGPVTMLRPITALQYGLNDALVYSQLAYRAKSSTIKHENNPVVRFSYTRIQKQLPYFSRRTIINIVSRLESKGAIKIVPTKRVNNIVIVDQIVESDLAENNSAAMLVFPELAKIIGIKEAIVLQQIHIRHHVQDGGYWVILPYRVWQSWILPFMSLGVIQRVFTNLKAMQLIYVKPYSSEHGVTHAYRVNYLRLAEILQVPIPEIKIREEKGWINQLYPKIQTIK